MRARFLVAAILVGCSGADPEAETTAPVVNDTGTATDGEIVSDTAEPGDVADDTATPAPTGGCGKATTTGVSNKTITVNGAERTYVLSIPTGYDSNKPTMLAFGLHGRTGNGTLFRTYSGVEKAAAGGAIFVYPDGLPVTSDPKDTGWQLGASGRDVALFDALVKELSQQLCVDSKKIVAFGHSFGGYFSNALGCHRSSVLRAIAPFAGGGPSGTCGSAVAAWIGHAKDDGVVNITEGERSRDFWVKKNTCATTTKNVSPDPCVGYDGCSAKVHWCATNTGGHGWPSWAAPAIWNFFSTL